VAVENLTTRLKMKNETLTSVQTKNHKMSHELRLIRPQTKHKRAKCLYLKFWLTPLTVCGESCESSS
jgi:hypothetical protein